MRYPLAFSLALLCAAAPAHAAPAKSPQPARYHFELAEVTLAPSAPAELAVKARSMFDQIVAGRPEVVQTLDNAPDPAKDPAGYRKYLDAHGVRAYALKLKVDQYQRALAPATPPAKGNVLTIRLNVSLVGAQIPGDALALAGSGGASVTAEVGPTLRPHEEEGAMDDVLREALTQALDDAIAKLKAPPRKAVRKKK